MPFPLLFTLNGASRHEVILVDPSTPIKALNKAIVHAATSASPNCAEFMSKYKKKYEEGTENIVEMRVHWSSAGRDSKFFPASTVLTEENCEAVLTMIEKAGIGRDVLEVEMEDM
ncbi:hypothetical protein K432DRAFT_353913 [Lepidopterella palustris CBS 459.81]|uniref:Uncharacterized protein n=1 Tax=Lepidopterella palustris CBS 459.81 TaxID=1314670 RepID=A0A8E2EAF7_9PEZI|nr:hypothetical protein K432DRAFT_353913 [Lepidopterella palustris CBS 459.81]